MSTTMEKLQGNKVKLRFEVEAEVFEGGMQKAYLKNRGRINVPGFRKGKAPRAMIERMYGEGVFYDDAFDAIFPDLYEEAVKTHGLKPVDRPSVDLEQVGSGQTLIFTAEVFVYPEVVLGQYKGVKVHKHEHPVTDDDVQDELNKAQEKVARTVQIEDRPVKLDDIANIDYAGSVDGVAFEGGTAQGHDLAIGSGNFIPGFEEQVVGMAAGEEKDIQVTFPEQYHAPELAGKPAVFHVKVNTISAKDLPALDDEFAQEVSEFDTLDAYKADIRAKLEADAAKHTQEALENDVVEAVVEGIQVDIPEPMIEREMDRMSREFEMRLARNGLKLADFLTYTGSTPEQHREQYREQATGRLKVDLALTAIEEAEGIEPTEEQVDAEIGNYADQVKQNLEEIKGKLSDEDKVYFRDIARRNATMSLLKAQAEICDCDDHEHDHQH